MSDVRRDVFAGSIRNGNLAKWNEAKMSCQSRWLENIKALKISLLHSLVRVCYPRNINNSRKTVLYY